MDDGDPYADEFTEELDDPKGGSNGQKAGADESNIPADTMQVIRDGVEDDKQRARAFWNVMLVLKRRGRTRRTSG